MNVYYYLLIAMVFFISFLSYSFSFFRNRILNFVINTFIYFVAAACLLYYGNRNGLGNISMPAVYSFLLGVLYFLLIKKKSGNNIQSSTTGKYTFHLLADGGKKIIFGDPFDNFLIYGGANSGKTKSIGKPLLEQYIQNGFAGFIYDYKDFDYTKTAYNLCAKYNYPYKFYYISFTDVSRSYRFNPIKPIILNNENLLVQLMDDLLSSLVVEGKRDEWFNAALGIVRGTASRFYNDFPHLCTIPHIINFIIHSGKGNLLKFLNGNSTSKALASGYIDAEDSERTQASMLSSLTNYIGVIAFNKEINYVLSGDDFDFNLIDADDPKLIAISNSYAIEGAISPIIALLLSISSRWFNLRNKVPFVYFLDEATTFKVRDFEKMPSVLREYLASFVILTQSGAKLEKLYGKNDRSSIESNSSNLFLGRTKDTEALKYYPLFFGKEDIKKKSHTRGSSSNSENSSVTISTQKEDRYEGHFFSTLKAGEFVGSAGHSNFTDFHLRFKMYSKSEKEIPPVKLVLKSDIEKNYDHILNDIFSMNY